MLHATVGYDEQYLLEHRTEPVVVRVHVDDILNELGLRTLYDEAHDELTRREDAIHARPRRRASCRAGLRRRRPGRASTELEQLRERSTSNARRSGPPTARRSSDNVHRAAAELFPGLRVPVEVVVELDWQNDIGLRTTWSRPGVADVGDRPAEHAAARLRHSAARTTRSCVDVAQVERDAGRTPLARLDNREARASRDDSRP